MLTQNGVVDILVNEFDNEVVFPDLPLGENQEALYVSFIVTPEEAYDFDRTVPGDFLHYMYAGGRQINPATNRFLIRHHYPFSSKGWGANKVYTHNRLVKESDYAPFMAANRGFVDIKKEPYLVEVTERPDGRFTIMCILIIEKK